jgi:hypothetical protein
MDPFSSRVGEEGVVDPRHARHNPYLRSNNSPERPILNLIEEEIEGFGTVSLIGVQCVVSRKTKMSTGRKSRKNLYRKLSTHQRQKDIGAVLRDGQYLFLGSSE